MTGPMAQRTWSPGDPLIDNGDQSVGSVRPMAQVIDDLENCRDGVCDFCNGRDVTGWTTAMTIKFGGAA